MWEAAGGRTSASLDAVSLVAILGDDPAATAAVAAGVARVQALRRRVFLVDLFGEGFGLPTHRSTDDFHGVSDAMHYGLSLGRIAHQVDGIPNLFVIAGGAETPLSQDVLTHRGWQRLFGEIRRAEALLLIVAPAMVPSMDRLVGQTDGVVLVGDPLVPGRDTYVLAEVRSAAAIRTPIIPQPAIAPRTSPTPRSGRRWLGVAALLAALAAAGAWQRDRIAGVVDRLAGDGAAAEGNGGRPRGGAGNGTGRVLAGDATYSVELLFTNSDEEAREHILRHGEHLPAATYAPLSVDTTATRWFRLLSGAFADSAGAANFLAELRARDLVGSDAGVIVWTPLAFLLDSAASEAMASVRVTAYRGRGIPAYVLRDAGVWRVYAGAFAAPRDGQLLQRQLDSLNIQSVLVTRTGSPS